MTSPPIASSTPADTLDPALVSRGRVYVCVAMGAFVGVSVAVAALQTWRFGPARLLTHAVRLALTGLLMYFLYQGARWARWLTVGLIVLALMVALPAFRGDAWSAERLPGTLALLALVIVYGVVGRGLLYSESVAAFLAHQRGRGLARRQERGPVG